MICWDWREADRHRALSRPTFPACPTMPRKIPNAIPWANSEARKVLLGDIERDVFPDDVPLLKAWESTYSKMEAFEKVPYLQFVERVEAHRKQVQKRKEKSVDDLARMMNTRLTLAPPKTFLGSNTHKLLREDVKQEMESGAAPVPTKEFQARRPEYQALTTTYFGQRLRQERKTRKFFNHLEEKRAANLCDDPFTDGFCFPLDDPEQEEYNKEDKERSDKRRAKKKKSA